MTDLRTARAVTRWHSNPELNWVRDTVGQHAERVADLIRRFHPYPSAELIEAAKAHDDGEWLTGDIPWPAKQRMPQVMREWLDDEERLGRVKVHGHDPLLQINRLDRAWLKWADRMDAYVFARCHGADITKNGWPEARTWLVRQTEQLVPNLAKHEDAMRYLDLGAM